MNYQKKAISSIGQLIARSDKAVSEPVVIHKPKTTSPLTTNIDIIRVKKDQKILGPSEFSLL